MQEGEREEKAGGGGGGGVGEEFFPDSYRMTFQESAPSALRASLYRSESNRGSILATFVPLLLSVASVTLLVLVALLYHSTCTQRCGLVSLGRPTISALRSQTRSIFALYLSHDYLVGLLAQFSKRALSDLAMAPLNPGILTLNCSA